MRTTFLAYGLIIATLSLLSCEKKNAIPLAEQVQVSRPLFGCDAYEAFDLTTLSSSLFFDEMAQFGPYFLYGGLSSLQIREGYSGPIVAEVGNHRATHFHSYNDRMFVYGTDGIYELLSNGNLVQRTSVGFWDLETTPEGLLIGVPFSDSWRIMAIDPVDFTFQPYLTEYPRGRCVTLGDLHFSADGSLWAVDCDNELLQFQNGALVSREIAGESDFWGEGDNYPLDDSIFFLDYQGRTIAVTKCGFLFYEILEYDGTQWTTLFRVNYEDENLSEKASELLRGAPNEAVIKGQHLYVMTNRGIHEFDLESGYEDPMEAVLNIKDPGLAQDASYELFQDDQAEWYVLNTQKRVVRLGCE
ncbi:hypothetical protein [Phaeodactylibacter xiamenensis]|uniref:hypothetical protein n=1 Tax=Phaeodactylibacter xiamenensis TaxID=1524460 RepID=UPI003BAB6896